MGVRGLTRLGGIVLVGALAAACGSATVSPSGNGGGGGGGNASHPITSASSPKAAVQQALVADATATSYAMKVVVALNGLSTASGSGSGASTLPASLKPIFEHGFQFTLTGGFDKSIKAFEGNIAVGPIAESFIFDGSAHLAYLKLPASIMSVMEHALPAGGAGVPAAEKSVLQQIAAHPNDWLEIDLTKIKTNSQVPSFLTNPGSLQSSKLMDAARAAIGKVSNAGTTTVDGTQATHFIATFDLASFMTAEGGVLSKALPSSSGPLKGILGSLAKALPTAMPFDVYVDQSGYARRIAMSLPIGSLIESIFSTMKSVGSSASNGGSPTLPASVEKQLSKLSIAVTTDLSNFGSSSNVVIPASNQVIDITPLASAAPKAVTGTL